MFSTISGPLRMYDYDTPVHMGVTYELNRDLKIIRRKVYGFLDLLGDIGGLSGSLYSIFFAAIIVL